MKFIKRFNEGNLLDDTTSYIEHILEDNLEGYHFYLQSQEIVDDHLRQEIEDDPNAAYGLTKIYFEEDLNKYGYFDFKIILHKNGPEVVIHGESHPSSDYIKYSEFYDDLKRILDILLDVDGIELNNIKYYGEAPSKDNTFGMGPHLRQSGPCISVRYEFTKNSRILLEPDKLYSMFYSLEGRPHPPRKMEILRHIEIFLKIKSKNEIS